jgi:hypothetical protein
MKRANERDMENLSFYCHVCGLITIFLGIVIIFLNFLQDDVRNIQSGIFIFIVGYAFVKISSKIGRILQDEKIPSTGLY